MYNLKEVFKTNLNFKEDREFIVFLKSELEKYGFFLEEDKILKLILFLKIVVEENKKYNLTAITKFEDMVYKHVIDSLLILKTVEIKKEDWFLDVGAGAGFPSIPVAIAKNLNFVLQIDSLKKRVNFLEMVRENLYLKIKPVHIRAEEAAKNKEYREKFKIVTARAVANLKILSELCLPFVAIGGFFIALKGPEYKEDLNSSKDAIKTVGGVFEKVERFKIEDSIRNIIVVKKISHSSTKYPRSFAKISKNPL